MSKELQTVYVIADNENIFDSTIIDKDIIPNKFHYGLKKEAYLYTPEEHEAAQKALATPNLFDENNLQYLAEEAIHNVKFPKDHNTSDVWDELVLLFKYGYKAATPNNGYSIPYQCCPLCGGTGETVADGYISAVMQVCKVCSGNKIIPMYHIPQPPKQ